MSDIERCVIILQEVKFIKQIVLFSDKCSLKECEKMEEDFDKELRGPARVSRIQLGRYLKNTEKTLKKEKEPKEELLTEESVEKSLEREKEEKKQSEKETNQD